MKNLVKNLKSGIVCILALMLIAGCTNNSGNSDVLKEDVYNIGITQIVDHAALNQVREGFEKKAESLGIKMNIDAQNAQGDISTSQVIANKFVSDGKDLIIAISTPSAQSAQNAVKNTKIPVVFAAVSDPVSAGLVDESLTSNSITGVTDKITKENIRELIDISKKLRPEQNSIGVIYNIGEANSLAQVEELKNVTEEANMELAEVGISSISDIDQAIEVIASKTDTLFLISDNMLASSMSLVTQKANDKGIITVSTVDTFVDEGALLSIGVNYEKLGEQMAEMVKQILIDKNEISTITVQDPIELYRKLNEETAKKLGIDLDTIKKELNI